MEGCMEHVVAKDAQLVVPIVCVHCRASYLMDTDRFQAGPIWATTDYRYNVIVVTFVFPG